MDRRSWWRPVAAICVMAGLVFVAWWGAEALRLEVAGRALLWPGAAGFGIAWMRREAMGREGAALASGAVVGILPIPLALELLPLTAAGEAIAVAAGAALVAVLVLVVRFPVGSSAIGFGTGIASAQAAGMDASTSAGDVVAALTAMLFAIFLGMVAAGIFAPGREEPEEELSVEDEAVMDPEALTITERLDEIERVGRGAR